MKRPNRKNNRLIKEIMSVPNGQGNVCLYTERVHAYCKRVGIRIKGYSDFIKRAEMLGLWNLNK